MKETSILSITILALTLVGCERTALDYHRSVSDWESAEVAQEGGQPFDTIWTKPGASYPHCIFYTDTDQDGRIDRRDEQRGERYTVSSFDDDRDGRFDRECVYSLDTPNSEKKVDCAVPAT
ncbi:hypothetical protein CA13_65470 [Planctomycetes bacterium CA13]|uniref:Uncharacterized protein n=1 Tax=Novipirellula herctigrandis TaxID=2527986 RepID=A0A5C5ZD31_9BACT|nr:hypothetical protein CA13_65470 [Planctomycetes bacterium CA13]